MLSLKDKLMKAGVVSEEQAKAAEERQKQQAAARPPPSSSHRRGPPPAQSAPVESRLPKFAPLPGSKQAQREESRKQVELDKKLRELVAAGEVPLEPGEKTFHFVTRKGKLRRLELSEAQAKLLEAGELAVVERPDPGEIAHALVGPETAFKLMPLSHRAVRFFAREGVNVGFVDGESEPPAAEAPQSTEAAPETAPEAAPMMTIKRAPLDSK